MAWFASRHLLEDGRVFLTFVIATKDSVMAASVSEKITEESLNEKLSREGLPPVKLLRDDQIVSQVLTPTLIAAGIFLPCVCIGWLHYSSLRRKIIRDSQSDSSNETSGDVCFNICVKCHSAMPYRRTYDLRCIASCPHPPSLSGCK